MKPLPIISEGIGKKQMQESDSCRKEFDISKMWEDNKELQLFILHFVLQD